MAFGVFLTKTASNEDSKLFPRFLTLWTNSKKLRYSGNLACDMPRCGRSQERSSDQSQLLELPGDHLTPASAGFRQNVLGAWADDPKRHQQIEQLADRISGWPTSP